MFNVGDRVVYPMHGAGVIESIEEREVLGKTARYYIMRMPVGDMKVMVPIEQTGVVGLREVVGPETARQILSILYEEGFQETTTWNRRYRDNMDKIKSGDAFAVADVVRQLSWLDRHKGLSTGEKRMFDLARQILFSELWLAASEEDSELLKELTDRLGAGRRTGC
ncbi:MAG: CarD family transcriptional regulator [Alicyclobacillaceae bacterium]|nr:CarD family transcriptional regulator [Alicyclobacillaceae bacterium]